MKSAHILLIDNFDSFTYNLVDQFRILGLKTSIYRNHIPYQKIINIIQDYINPILVFSPGPSTPDKAGNMPELIQHFKGKLPILGICLGHQAIIEAYGGSIGKANQIFHGKTSNITTTPHPVFSGLSNPLIVGRYHALIGTKIPKSLKIIAKHQNQIMSIAHKTDKTIGYQFHPESILTTQGETLLKNTIKWLLSSDQSSTS